jgi:hypothetical protein
MDAKITRIEVLLDKINLLFAQVQEDGALDKVEAGLLLKYTEQLTALLRDEAVVTSVRPQENRVEVEEKKIVETIIPEAKQEIIPPKEIIREQPVEIQAPEVKTVEPVVEHKVEEVKIEQPPVEIPVQKVEAPVYEDKTIQPEKTVEKQQRKPLVKHADDEDEEEALKPELDSKLSSHKDKKTLADKITSHKAKDLVSMIDLSTRIALQRQLFNNDKTVYDAVIKSINAMPDFATAEKYIRHDLTEKFGWADAEDVEQLLEVVQQKFS